jgi:hypothetical protein
MKDRYILNDDGTVRPEPDLLMWARWFEQGNRKIAHDDLSGGVLVSTVFLGLDHSFGGVGPPILFETMIFGGEHDGYMDRYRTREEALAGHAKALRIAKGDEKP